MPALPLHEAGKYVAAAYIVVFTLVLIYVAIMAIRLSRMERELGELLKRADHQRARPASTEPDVGRPPQESDALDLGRPESTPV
jgi:CcmD family protein